MPPSPPVFLQISTHFTATPGIPHPSPKLEPSSLSPSVAVRPLRPATDRCLGEPLPHQLANRTRAPLRVLACASFDLHFFKSRMLCGISVPFGTLSPARRQVTHVLLTRLPLYSWIAPLSRSTCMC